MEQPPLSRKTMWLLGAAFAAANIVIHIPFLFRYDLYFQSDVAVCHLMAKQIMRGGISIYNWGCDYGGVGPVDFLTALLFKIFGASIPLSGFVSLLFWATGVGLLTGYAAMAFGKRAAIAAGCALAVGMPHFLLYCTQPLSSTYPQAAAYIGGFLWLTVLMVRRGPQNWLTVLTAFLMGWFWYAHKQVLVVWLAIGVTLCALPQGREFLLRFVKSKMALFAAIAFLIGYSPEIYYKLGLTGDQHERVADTAKFFTIASPEKMAQNWYMLFRCILTYVDADPWSRNHSSVHYLNHMENWESFPLSPLDTIGILAAFVVGAFVLKTGIASYREKKLEVFLPAALILVDVALIIIAAKADGSYYSIRRYLLPTGIVGLMWGGVRFASEDGIWKWGSRAVIGGMVAISLFHQYQMLEIPDQLVDYKKTAKQIEDAGHKYGLSWFPYSHTLTALTDERVQFGIIDRRFQCPYQKPALAAEVVAVVWPAIDAPPYEFAQKLFFGSVRFKNEGVRSLPESIALFGHEYRRISSPTVNSELAWAPYRKTGLAASP